MNKSKGIIYLIPSFLSETDSQKVFPNYNYEIVQNLEIFIVENIRTARRFLRKIGFKRDFEEITFHILDKRTLDSDIGSFLNEVQNGKDIGLLSEAGTPCIADPGGKIVEIAHQKSIRSVPLVGPNSIILALMASGFNGQNFAFHGYLPIDSSGKRKKLKELEQNVFKQNQTQIFIETPYRNRPMLEAITQSLSPKGKLCIASDITGKNESIITKSIGKWKNETPDFHKIPTVFLLYK